MIKLKESYGFGTRLYDTNTGKYVVNNAENRREAMFCYLLKNEVKFAQSGAPREAIYSVMELVDKYKYLLVQNNHIQNNKDGELTKEDVDTYLTMIVNHFAGESLVKDEDFVKLAVCVLKDQQDKKTMAYFSDIDKLEDKYRFMDEKIIANAELNEEM